MATFILATWKLMPKTKSIGWKQEISAENTAWIWFLLKLHQKMISLKNSSKEVRQICFFAKSGFQIICNPLFFAWNCDGILLGIEFVVYMRNENMPSVVYDSGILSVHDF